MPRDITRHGREMLRLHAALAEKNATAIGLLVVIVFIIVGAVATAIMSLF